MDGTPAQSVSHQFIKTAADVQFGVRLIRKCSSSVITKSSACLICINEFRRFCGAKAPSGLADNCSYGYGAHLEDYRVPLQHDSKLG